MKQALRTPEKDCRHQQIHRGTCGLRDEHLAEGVGKADQQRGEERAPDRADAADHHDDEADDEHLRAHPRVDRGYRRRDHAGESGECDTQREHQPVDEVDVETERRNHLAIRRAGPDHHADARAVNQEIEECRRAPGRRPT